LWEDFKSGPDPDVGTVLHTADSDGRHIFHLVTKSLYYGKPSLSDFRLALDNLVVALVDAGVSDVAAPQLGAGLDRMHWPFIVDVIKAVFAPTGLNMTIYLPVRLRTPTIPEFMIGAKIERQAGYYSFPFKDRHGDMHPIHPRRPGAYVPSQLLMSLLTTSMTLNGISCDERGGFPLSVVYKSISRFNYAVARLRLQRTLDEYSVMESGLCIPYVAAKHGHLRCMGLQYSHLRSVEPCVLFHYTWADVPITIQRTGTELDCQQRCALYLQHERPVFNVKYGRVLPVRYRIDFNLLPHWTLRECGPGAYLAVPSQGHGGIPTYAYGDRVEVSWHQAMTQIAAYNNGKEAFHSVSVVPCTYETCAVTQYSDWFHARRSLGGPGTAVTRQSTVLKKRNLSAPPRLISVDKNLTPASPPVVAGDVVFVSETFAQSTAAGSTWHSPEVEVQGSVQLALLLKHPHLSQMTDIARRHLIAVVKQNLVFSDGMDYSDFVHIIAHEEPIDYAQTSNRALMAYFTNKQAIELGVEVSNSQSVIKSKLEQLLESIMHSAWPDLEALRRDSVFIGGKGTLSSWLSRLGLAGRDGFHLYEGTFSVLGARHTAKKVGEGAHASWLCLLKQRHASQFKPGVPFRYRLATLPKLGNVVVCGSANVLSLLNFCEGARARNPPEALARTLVGGVPG
jgi:hypothetical protein